MTTPSKRTPASGAKSPARVAASKSSSPDKPFLRFYHPQSLRTKTLALLTTIEHAEDPTIHREALSKLIMELTGSGMDYYFMAPLKLAKAGFVVEQSAKLGLAGVQQVMGSVVRQIVGRMNKPQLLSVCGSIRQLML